MSVLFHKNCLFTRSEAFVNFAYVREPENVLDTSISTVIKRKMKQSVEDCIATSTK